MSESKVGITKYMNPKGEQVKATIKFRINDFFVDDLFFVISAMGLEADRTHNLDTKLHRGDPYLSIGF